MSDRYQAYLFNHDWLVIDHTTKLPCGEPLATQSGAEAEAARLNLKDWKDAKPRTAVSETISWEPEDPAELLLGIIDKPYVEHMTFAEAA